MKIVYFLVEETKSTGYTMLLPKSAVHHTLEIASVSCTDTEFHGFDYFSLSSLKSFEIENDGI